MTKFLKFEESSHLAYRQPSTDGQGTSDHGQGVDRVTTAKASSQANSNDISSRNEVAKAEASSEENPNSSSYDVRIDGPITYFQYYFDEANQPFSVPPQVNQPPKSNAVSIGIIGAGALAATVVSGLWIANTVNKPDVEPDNKPVDSTNTRQNSTIKSSSPTPTSPEKLDATRSLTSQQTQSTSKPDSELSKTQSFDGLFPPLPPLTTTALPAGLGLSQSPQFSSSSSLSSSTNKPNRSATSSPNQNLPNLGTPQTSPARPQNSTSIAAKAAGAGNTSQPEAASGDPSSQSVAQQPNTQPSSFSATTPFPPSPNNSSPQLDAANSGMANPNMAPPEVLSPEASAKSELSATSATQPQATPGNSESAELQSKQISSPGDRPSEPSNPATNQIAANDSNPPGSPQGIKDYLTLPQKAATSSSVTLMPLTQKAADEAVGSKQIGPFAVRQVATQEYQKEWVASNKNSEDPTIAYAFPAYGFIDYQRQVIVVLQSESEASVQSPNQRFNRANRLFNHGSQLFRSEK
ncbi:MAG: hypothetical protein HC866_14465 [Leptolyngbyaceae cyanobacterium RU_5_1]|nr:hypothetical protein [Leptolyngbyaceae cyanobacterium RU_5_1]